MIFYVFLSAWSITNIIVHGSIFKPIRTWILTSDHSFFGNLISCFMCSSVWVSALVWVLIKMILPDMNLIYNHDVLDFFLFTASSSGISYIIDMTIWKLFIK
jgi:hypothetical protein